MNMNNLPKKECMGWNKCLRLMTLLVFVCLNLCTMMGQDKKAQIAYDRLVGADPDNIANTKNDNREAPFTSDGRKYTFMLMNVGTQQFFNVGGSYGRHATLNDNGMLLWIFNNSTTAGTYNIRTNHNMVGKLPGIQENLDNKDSYVQYVDNDPRQNGVYPDINPTDATRQFGWTFEQATGYSATNKIYKIKTYGNRYLTAVPDDADNNKCQAITEAATNANYQVWKLVTLEEFYNLLDDSPSDSQNPIDVTSLIDNPGFAYNLSNKGKWQTTGQNSYDVRFGIDDYFKKKTETNYQGAKINDAQYHLENGKYFCAAIKDRQSEGVEQWITINKPGWYVLRCDGVSNTNGLAKLYIKEFYTATEGETTTLKAIENNGPSNMLEAGKAFYNDKSDKYKNEVKIHIPKDIIDNMGEAMLIIGIEVGGDANADATGQLTAFDNFRLLYYEEAEKPELVLDEENPDLNYLTETSDAYENVKLHLNRSFTLNKWNTLTLPVSLTYGQMKSTFGNDVLLAKLHELSATTVRFKTVDCTSDDEVMLEAFTPYIIKPTKAAEATTEAYTTPRLKKTPNQYWLADGVGETNAEDGKTRHISGKVKVEAGHYTIAGVTLNREALKANLDNHWVSTTTPSATTPSASAMTCKGTMVKTYYVDSNKKGMFYTDNGVPRDDLAGDYFMNNGTMWKVPATKQYGLKAFRCWFELSNTTDNASPTTAPAKEVSLFIDNIKDGVTGIDDITTDPNSSVAKSLNGVYNIYGQRVSDGSSLDNLPQGIYIVNGKKVKK